MTRQEAERYWMAKYEAASKWDDPYWEASERKAHRRYVDAIKVAIEALQTEIVRCKDCKHYSLEGETTRFGWCGYWNKPTDGMRYCSDGERREP